MGSFAGTRTSASTIGSRGRFDANAYDKLEIDDHIKRHVMYMKAVFVVYFIVVLVIALINMFAHSKMGYYSREFDNIHYGGIWKYCHGTQGEKSGRPFCNSSYP